jgi:DNA-binding NarL/FixJ family response regulator
MSGTLSSPVRRNRVARVVIVDDNDLARAGMRFLLAGESSLEIVGEAVNGRQAVHTCCRLRPDLVLLDVCMPEMDGISATRAIKAASSRTIVIILTMHESPEYLLAALEAGAAGYLLKDISRKELIIAIKDVLGGKVILNGPLATHLIRQMSLRSSLQPTEQVENLTSREVEVLRLVAQGLSNRDIAAALVISPGTAKIHVEHILGKLNVSDRTQAAVLAAKWGLFR